MGAATPGRACALLAWFRDETEVRLVNLNATEHGMGLYRSAGFAPPRYPALQLFIELLALVRSRARGLTRARR